MKVLNCDFGVAYRHGGFGIDDGTENQSQIIVALDVQVDVALHFDRRVDALVAIGFENDVYVFVGAAHFVQNDTWAVASDGIAVRLMIAVLAGDFTFVERQVVDMADAVFLNVDFGVDGSEIIEGKGEGHQHGNDGG